MAAKKSRKTIATTNGDSPKSKAELTNTIAAKFSDDEIARIDTALETDLGPIPKAGFVRSVVLKAIAEREAAAAE